MANISEIFKEKLPKYNHLENIRKKLLSEDGGRVSVMIGSGFSLNADKIGESLDGMSTWSDLKEKLLEELGLDDHSINVLELSQKYVDEYGRYSLEDLIKQSVPDQNYEPGELHKKLLRLPWTDVYTTNYDTLLERTLPNIYDRNYQVVYESRDISNSVAPRIVKLHGSFPSNRPFIFTKKDYENYYQSHAPLVNMVQQSIMETTFILIGFSGDDPNFQKWTRWVHENLGEHMPNIYMISYNEGEKGNDIDKHGITLIDFKEVYKNENLSNPYYKLFKDLFGFLGTREEKNPENWPYEKYGIFNKNLRKATQMFINNRKNYPGWMVLPDIIRKSNIEIIQSICNNLEDLIEESEENIKEKTVALYELLWVYDLFQLPLTVSLQELMKKTVNESIENVNGYNISEDVTYIILRLIKEARLDFNEAEFNEYVDMLKGYSLKQKDKHQLMYEKILIKLIKYEFSRVSNVADKWIIDDNEIEWKVKKAVVLLLLDKKEEAKQLLETSLNSVRKIISRKGNNNYRFLSMEGIILSNLRRLNSSSYKDGKDRLSILESVMCNPLKELNLMYSRMKSYERETGHFKEKGFDPNRIKYRQIFKSTWSIELVDSYSLVILNEELGLKPSPTRSAKNAIKIALSNFENLYPFYSWVTYLRLGDEKWVDNFFSRKIIFRTHRKSLTKIYSIAINAIENNQNTNLMLEILSRLYFALLKEEKEAVDEIVMDVYSNEEFHNYNGIKVYKILSNLFSRILFDKSDKEKEKFIEKIYKAPIIGDPNGKLSEVEYDNTFYFDPSFEFNLADPDNIDLKVDSTEIDRLIGLLDSEKPLRDAALKRAIYLLKTGNLTEDTEERLRSKIAELIRIKDNISNPLLKSYLLLLTNDNELQANFCDNFIKRPIPKSYDNRSGLTIGDSLDDYLRDLKNVFPDMLNGKKHFLSITYSTYKEWLKRFFEWWEDQKEWLLTNDNKSIFERKKNDLLLMIIFLKKFFFLNIPLKSLSESDKNELTDVYTKLKEARLDIAVFLIPVFLRIGIVDKKEIRLVETSLLDNDQKIYESASVAVSDLVILDSKDAIDADLLEAKSLLLNLYKVRKELTLLEVTKALNSIIHFVPRSFKEDDYLMIIRTLNLIYNDLMNDYYYNSSIADQESELMAESTRLAGEISQVYGQSEASDLDKWKDLSKNSRLPEVRQHNHLYKKNIESH